jgi:hypothetical protein
MSQLAEPLSLRARCLRDVGKLALLALVGVPIYLLLNEFWQSVLRLGVLYGLLALFCLRLGEWMHRAMRRLPAEIPPWQDAPSGAPATPWFERRFGAAEAVCSACQDPQYVQMVLKPHLRRLLVHRIHGRPDVPFEMLEDTQLARVEPRLVDFLRRPEPTGLWARYRYRQRRLDDVLETLRHLEGL